MGELYSEYYDLLYPVAFNILHDREEAEDMVQDTILSWLNRESSHIENVKGYLVRSIINKSLNRIRDRKKSRQVEIAPELLTDYIPALVEQKDRLSYSLLLMMERLNSVERAVFILKEIFGYSHKEISEILDISEANSRQILVRAKRRIQQEEGRYEVDNDHHLELFKRFIAVCDGEDLSRLLEILQEDAKLEQSGPKASWNGRSYTGKLQVAEYMLLLFSSNIWMKLLYQEGMPLLILYLWGIPVGSVQLSEGETGIETISITWEDLLVWENIQGVSIVPGAFSFSR